MEDITIRAIKTLFSVDIIACEDTRRTGLLLQELKKRYSGHPGIDPGSSINKMDSGTTAGMTQGSKLIRYDDQHEQSHAPFLIQKLEEGKSVALVSDAGTPLISDPGYTLVREAVKRNIKVVSVPGPSAAIAALSVSGLPTNNFLFLGYPPEKQSHRKELFLSLSDFKRPPLARARGGLDKPITIIFYCAPHKLLQTLGDMKEALGDIDIVIARELTKVHEEVWRGKLSETLNHFSDTQGEFVVLFNVKYKHASTNTPFTHPC